MIQLEFRNVNPKNKKTSDCVIRALSVASGKDYYEVMDELYELSKKTGHMFNTKQTYEKWLEMNDFDKYKQPKKECGSKWMVGDINKLTFEDKSIVISMANHLSAVVDNKLVDTWDCRRKYIGNYWVKR